MRRLCPRCDRAQDGSAARCECGYEFLGTEAKVLDPSDSHPSESTVILTVAMVLTVIGIVVSVILFVFVLAEYGAILAFILFPVSIVIQIATYIVYSEVRNLRIQRRLERLKAALD